MTCGGVAEPAWKDAMAGSGNWKQKMAAGRNFAAGQVNLPATAFPAISSQVLVPSSPTPISTDILVSETLHAPTA
jgi:hypothetical protein